MAAHSSDGAIRVAPYSGYGHPCVPTLQMQVSTCGYTLFSRSDGPAGTLKIHGGKQI